MGCSICIGVCCIATRDSQSCGAHVSADPYPRYVSGSCRSAVGREPSRRSDCAGRRPESGWIRNHGWRGWRWEWRTIGTASAATPSQCSSRRTNARSICGRLTVLVFAFVKVGRGDRTATIYQALLERRSREYVPPFVLALCAAALENPDAAFRHCDQAVEEGDVLFAAWFEWWPDLDAMRKDARFAEIRRRFNARKSR